MNYKFLNEAVADSFKEYCLDTLEVIKGIKNSVINTPKVKITKGVRRQCVINFSIPSDIKYTDSKKTSFTASSLEKKLSIVCMALNVPNNKIREIKMDKLLNRQIISVSYEDNGVAIDLEVKFRDTWDLEDTILIFNLTLYGEEVNGINDPNDKYKVGTILYSSTGYSMTSISFYQVIGRPSKSSVVLQTIGEKVVSGSHGITGEGTVIADPSQKIGKPMQGKLTKFDTVAFRDAHGFKETARLWNGRELAFTDFD